ncbi:DUF4344 domain-containing metallopeptidase [Thiofilum flexile]|uniref:DUF4344 domain-containing metallopeptidase n=1 Tax=Thiofilum flexile TaxID=125627 RepID=UPI000378F5BC|nr:DUF4344 domain-containing metallopeptidase [Thiofilum flexile]
MKRLSLATLLWVCLLGWFGVLPSAGASTSATLSVQFHKAHTPAEAHMRQLLSKMVEIQDFAKFVNQEFRLLYPIQIRFGHFDGPLFDLKTHTIDVPYNFMAEMILLFNSARYGRTGLTSTQAAMDTLIYVLFHELGHAFIDMYKIPLFAKEEDVADYFATTILLDSFSGGAEITISTADMFDIANRVPGKAKGAIAHWDDHSGDIVRSQRLLCHVYGSNPKHYQYLANYHKFLKNQDKRCTQRYQQLLASWSIQLTPYLKPSSTRLARTVIVPVTPTPKPKTISKTKQRRTKAAFKARASRHVK